MTIAIWYNPPAGVTLTPPNYRAATSVSLRCLAGGTTGYVSYQWSSTCGSSCFVRGSTQSISRVKLSSYEAGQHTCTVTDGAGNTGMATTEMIIIGISLVVFPLYILQYHKESNGSSCSYLGKSLHYVVWRCDITLMEMCLYGNCSCIDWMVFKYIIHLRTVVSLVPILANKCMFANSPVILQ